jgi:hypothetical protein
MDETANEGAPYRTPERSVVDQTPDPDEIDRTPAAERGSKMPSMPGTAMDPKKMIGFAAAGQTQARTRTRAI